MPESSTELQNELKRLYEKYLANETSREEFDRLHDLFLQAGLEEHALYMMTQTWHATQLMPGYTVHEMPPLPLLDQQNNRVKVIRLPVLPKYWVQRIAAAAIVLILLLGGAYLVFRESAPSPQTVQYKKHDVLPGGDKAVLTLADGSTIILDSAGDGRIAWQGAVSVIKRTGGELSYERSADDQEPPLPIYNTLATPRGGQYKLTLPDGSKVWLNAASSIRYPTEFAGSGRTVEITGEAYLEVAKDRSKPFFVITKTMTVEVLGTHFNINAYDDEPTVTTTLLEGSVKVSGYRTPATDNGMPEQAVVLEPGQQAKIPLADMDRAITVEEADTERVIAWKEGLFSFKGADIKTIMRQLGRWYSIDIKYEGAVREYAFVGSVPRQYNLSEVLSVLEASGIHFRIEDRRIIVLP